MFYIHNTYIPSTNDCGAPGRESQSNTITTIVTGYHFLRLTIAITATTNHTIAIILILIIILITMTTTTTTTTTTSTAIAIITPCLP